MKLFLLEMLLLTPPKQFYPMAPQPHTSEVEKRMRMFGEAARGSSERFEKLVEVYSRVESNNRVNLEDFYVLRDADVDIAEIVSEKAGFS
ncbi:conserved hypothetical protein (plasmid) [Borreliella afzelii ACA-1]|uniref:Uncharacterized protein n=1 Tax=Borreliella afzelii TaxID=29518 RepID=A0AB34Z374_BORAF|nr:conserved hypothetical protein [Borreliella afzelii ACA-1]MBB5141690.1 hypothetical protein [Borreliella afzelii]